MKRSIIISLILILVLTACNNGNKATNTQQDVGNSSKQEVNVERKTDESKENTVTLNRNNNEEVVAQCRYEEVSSKALDEYRYYSPDRKNFISDVNEGSNEGDFFSIKVYLNNKTLVDKKSDFYWEQYKRSKGGIWLNNNEVLINGEYVLNIQDNTKKSIDFSKILEEGLSIHNYSVNKDKSKIAYIIIGNYTESIYVYDRVESSFELITKLEYHHTQPEFYNISWGIDDKIYFDVSDFDKQTKSSSNSNEDPEMKYFIYKINMRDKKIDLYKEDFQIKAFSQSLNYALLYSVKEKTYRVLKMENGSEILKNNAAQFSWSDRDDDILAFCKDKEFVLYSAQKSKEIANMDISNIINKGYNVNCIRYFDTFVFYAGNENESVSKLYKVNFRGIK